MDPVIPNPDKNILVDVPDRPVGDFFPLQAPTPKPDEFEIGLVLGGTVSAAAYTAGVLDFLIEALDAWTVAKGAGGAPNHKVTIKIVSGTSGGGVNSVLLARALGYAFPHFKAGLPADTLKKNPFYELWVNQIDIRDLLQTTDLDAKKPISSLLCADKIVSAANAMGNYTGDPLGTG
ncbi:MAG TPA: patatin-like phospholipase family protein, partial [Micropepsaceae bacterium]|nr:patatin-like phospholipase family protein [Micropepsaceae bacterium]